MKEGVEVVVCTRKEQLTLTWMDMIYRHVDEERPGGSAEAFRSWSQTAGRKDRSGDLVDVCVREW